MWHFWTALALQGHERLLSTIGHKRAEGSFTPESTPPSSSAADTGAALVLQECSHVAVAFDANARCLYLHSRWESLTGRTVASCMNERWLEAVDSDYQGRIRAVIAHAHTEEDGLGKKCSFLLQRANGIREWWELKLMKRGEVDGAPVVFGLLEHTDALTRFKRELARAQADAAEALQAREAFLSGVSHELRTPLNAILGFAQLMESGVLGELGNKTYEDYVRHIRGSGEDLLTRINALLDDAHMEGASARAEAYAQHGEAARSAVPELRKREHERLLA